MFCNPSFSVERILGVHPEKNIAIKTTGKIGIANQQIRQKIPQIDLTIIKRPPIIITLVLNKAPINRDINLSRDLRIRTSKDPPLATASICRNGANQVLTKRPNEKVFIVLSKLTRIFSAFQANPLPYHQEKKAINIIKLYTNLQILTSFCQLNSPKIKQD